MPVTKSAKKALRVAKRKRKVNLAREKKLKQALKLFKNKGMEVWPETQSAIDKLVKKNIIHRNKAGRLKAKILRNLSKILQKGQKP